MYYDEICKFLDDNVDYILLNSGKISIDEFIKKGMIFLIKLNKSDWRDYKQAIQKEWILTNGIGGFSSSTIIGANARRYHGLLFASLHPPVKRDLMLSKIDESVFIDGAPYNIYSFSTGEYKMKGYNYQQEFSLDPLPHYKYMINPISK